MAGRPDRPTYLESLDDDRRATLLDMANLLQKDRHRLQSLRKNHPNEQPVKTTRPLDSTSLYMKSIWQLRHQLNALTIDHDATKQQLIESEKRCRALESELQVARYQHNARMSTMAEQVEELISRSDMATRSAHLALERQQQSDADRSETESKLSTLRSLLASDFARSESVQVVEETRRHANMLEKLMTPDVMEASRPPDEFQGSSARPFTVQEFRLMEATIKQSTAEKAQLRNQLEALQSRSESAQLDSHEKMKLWEDQKTRLNQSLTGAARRIQWLVGEKRKMAKSFQSLNEYATKLEKKLLQQYEELQTLKAAKQPNKRAKVANSNKSSSKKTDTKRKSDDGSQSSVKQQAELQPAAEQSSHEKSNGVPLRPPHISELVQAQIHQDQVGAGDDKRSLLEHVPLRIQFGLDRCSETSIKRPTLSELVKSAIEKETDSDS